MGQIKMSIVLLHKAKAMSKQYRLIEERAMFQSKLSITSVFMDLLQVRQLKVNPLSLVR